MGGCGWVGSSNSVPMGRAGSVHRGNSVPVQVISSNGIGVAAGSARVLPIPTSNDINVGIGKGILET